MGLDVFGSGGFGSRNAKRGGRTRKKKRSKAGPRDAQGYLFDDLFDEEEDIDIGEGYEDEGPDHPALDPSIVPPGLLELMGEVKESNHGKKNLTFSEFMSIVAKHPGLSKALIDIMNKTTGGRTRRARILNPQSRIPGRYWMSPSRPTRIKSAPPISRRSRSSRPIAVVSSLSVSEMPMPS